MTDPSAARAFLLSEIEALAAFDFVAVSPGEEPLQLIEVTRREEGGLEVRVPGRPPVLPELPAKARSRLREQGFASEDPSDARKPWVRAVKSAEEAVEVVQATLTGVFDQKPDAPLNVAHGSHRAEHEARKKLSALRARVEKVLAEMTGQPPEQDADGDYVLPVNDVHVVVAPRVVPGGSLVVRVFTVTNVGITMAPELGLFLARLNFGLMFGRFALDAEHRSIWVDEALFGDQFSDEELRFIVGAVATIADEWDDRLKQMFGGATYQDVLQKRVPEEVPPTKPGQGGYL